MTSCEGNDVNQQRLGIMVICYMLAYLIACLRKSAKHQKLTFLVSSCGALYVLGAYSLFAQVCVACKFSAERAGRPSLLG